MSMPPLYLLPIFENERQVDFMFLGLIGVIKSRARSKVTSHSGLPETEVSRDVGLFNNKTRRGPSQPIYLSP